MYKDTLQKVKRFMTETGMLQNCSEIILGVSGGPDSMTMLHILNELRDEFGYRLRVVHVNHGIRGKEAIISTADSKVKVVVIPTDEELMIASDTMTILSKEN